MAIATISDGESGSSVRTKLNAVIAVANRVWTEVVLGSDIPNSTTTNTDVTGLTFTPEANKIYDVECDLIVSTPIATTGAQVGVTPPGGTAMTATRIQTISNSTTLAILYATTNDSTNVKSNAAGHTTGNIKALVSIKARIVAGATPTGTFQVTVASEVGTSEVVVYTGSSLRYREVA